MQFFVPHATDSDEAESVYSAFAKFVGAAVPAKKSARIRALSWQHNGKDFAGEVGKPMPSYYEVGSEPILAIFDCGDHFKICTPSRGGVRGDPILAGGRNSQVTYFEG
ncbi:hypothetical protein [Sphingopyxis sp. GC21]|uniref:hypothetical protein n=1 Tax=Sphingopyxis sp. GC21 TaxID=2933562 RepID=UPI0021E3AEED|nr:hypothetical protein [Sphingopyxis sp. GC21]